MSAKLMWLPRAATSRDVFPCWNKKRKMSWKRLCTLGGTISTPTQHLRQQAQGLLSNASSQDLFSICEHLRRELVSSSCVQGMGSGFPGSAASPLLLQGICQFCRSHWKSFLQPTNTWAAIRGPPQLCSPRYFIAFCTAGLLTHETKVIYTTSLTLQAPDTHD